MSYIGSDKIDEMYIGNTKIAKAYLGSTLVYQNKPYDAEVEYLQSSGTQYIDTGIIIESTDTIDIDAMYRSKSGDNFLTGASALVSGQGSIWLEIYSNRTYYTRYGSTSSVSIAGDINVKHSFKAKKGYFYVDGVHKSTPGYASMPQRSLFIFGRNQSTPIGGVVRIYEFTITKANDEVIMHLIPVRIGTTGYMYDKVSGQLFGNDGTGNFVLGPDKTT